jgi:hypothetical protein
MIVPAFKINETIQDDNIDGSCDTTGNQQDEEECYERSALQANMPATPYEK